MISAIINEETSQCQDLELRGWQVLGRGIVGTSDPELRLVLDLSVAEHPAYTIRICERWDATQFKKLKLK